MASQKQNIVQHPSNSKASQPKLETYCHESTNSIASSRDDMHTSTSIMLVCILHTTATDSCAPCLLLALGAQVAPKPSIRINANVSKPIRDSAVPSSNPRGPLHGHSMACSFLGLPCGRTGRPESTQYQALSIYVPMYASLSISSYCLSKNISYFCVSF